MYSLVGAVSALVLSYFGYIIVYLIAKQRLVSSSVAVDEITLLGSIPSFTWFIVYTLIALLIGSGIGYSVFRMKK